MATAFYGGNFFGGEFFSETVGAEEVVVKTGGKGGDARKRRSIVKPLGLPPYGRKTVEERVEEAREVLQEVIQEARVEIPPKVEEAVIELEMPVLPSEADLVKELRVLLKKQLDKDEEEAIAVILMAADL